MLHALCGTHRLRPGAPPAAVLDRIAARLDADPACTDVSRTPDGVQFRLNPARWKRWPALIGMSPRGGRIAAGHFSARADTPRDLVNYTTRLEIGPPLTVALVWTVLLIGLAVWGWVPAALAALLLGLAALRFVVRQGETEWMHRLIERAAGDAAESRVAPLNI